MFSTNQHISIPTLTIIQEVEFRLALTINAQLRTLPFLCHKLKGRNGHITFALKRCNDILKTGPEEAQYFHVRPPIGFI